MLKAILFDIDGTLVDSNDFHVLAWAEAFKQAGHEMRLSTIHDQVGQGGDNLVPALLPDLSPEELKRLEDSHHQLFEQHYSGRLQPFPSARALLRRCKEAGYRVVLASSASADEVERNLQVLDAADLVDASTSSDEVDCSKPCPDVFNVALRKAGAQSNEAIVVGDTPFDIKAADKAGLRVIALRSGLFTDAQLRGAVAIYDDVADLLAQFDESPLSRASTPA
ncbi:HAD family hydrolase [Sphingomonas sp. KRR8]|uniref:HAD family hydrolase n=1 Tax=Sphingomonas sp. KRR8 TaxID=2942996 RepID=UPI00201FDB24|nr:HAD family hydrolase [Sphingomonas sp. KRR8]URD61468.1 HAD family hydrolase [Sphingomonas sp. KRR8]